MCVSGKHLHLMGRPFFKVNRTSVWFSSATTRVRTLWQHWQPLWLRHQIFFPLFEPHCFHCPNDFLAFFLEVWDFWATLPMLTTRLGLLGQATQPAFDLSADWSHSSFGWVLTTGSFAWQCALCLKSNLSYCSKGDRELPSCLASC